MKTSLRELAPAARGTQYAGSRNLVVPLYLTTVDGLIKVFFLLSGSVAI